MLNSLIYDYPYRFRNLQVIETRTAWDSHLDHITGNETLWPTLWQTNEAVAQAHGLDSQDLAHPLQTFPCMAKKGAEFVKFIQSILKLNDQETKR